MPQMTAEERREARRRKILANADVRIGSIMEKEGVRGNEPTMEGGDFL